MEETKAIIKLPHHIQERLCRTRPPYRQGKRLTAVKVYTVNNESQHLIISGVPKLQLTNELKKLAHAYGDIKTCCPIPEYPAEEFTEAYHVQYVRIQSARMAKRIIDGKNFFGGSLHVFYAPELESIPETRLKLTQRRLDIGMRIKKQERESLHENANTLSIREQYGLQKEDSEALLINNKVHKTYPKDVSISTSTNISEMSASAESRVSLITTQASAQFSRVPISMNSQSKLHDHNDKQKNYKGQSIRNTVKVRFVRPNILNMPWIERLESASSSSTTSSTTEKAQDNFSTKVLTKDIKTKRIIIKTPGISRLVEPSENLRSSIRLAKSHVRRAVQNIYSATNSLS